MTNRIAQLRKERRISQAELADAVDVTRQTIISLENGRYNASLLLAHKIAKYFGMTIEEVFLFEEEEPCQRDERHPVRYRWGPHGPGRSRDCHGCGLAADE